MTELAEIQKPSYEARIIGETSAGMTAIEIYIDDELYWSNNYFENGASSSWYADGLRQIFDDAMACDTVCYWAEWDEFDDDGNPAPEEYDTSNTTWIVATYKPESGWNFTEAINDGQSYDFIQANKDRIPADVLADWTKIYE